MKKPVIVFDENRHAYAMNGIEVPSVTRILGTLYTMPDNAYVYYRASIGNAVHKAVEYVDRGVEFTLDASCEGYIRAYRSWVSANAQTHINGEQMVGHVACPLYAGRYDKKILMCGKRWIVDVKTGARAPWHKMQVTAYMRAEHGTADRAGCLYLREDGTYEWDPVPLRLVPQAWAEFLACARYWHIAHKYGRVHL